MLFNPNMAHPELVRHASPSEPARVAIQAAVTAAETNIRLHEAGAVGGSPQAVHKMRAAARRLRSELRALKPLIEPASTEPIEAALRWLGQVLGQVRDLDVLHEKLKQSAAELEPELEPLFDRIAERRQAALAEVRRAVESDRYRALLAALSDPQRTLQLADKAEAPCRKIVPKRVRAAWKSLQKKGRAIQQDAPDEALHLVRKRAKRVRYAAELAAHTLGDRAAHAAARFAKQARQVQDVLGRHQDAVVALQWLGQNLPELPQDGPFQRALGRLIERQVRAADEARAEFPRAWSELDSRKLRKWL